MYMTVHVNALNLYNFTYITKDVGIVIVLLKVNGLCHLYIIHMIVVSLSFSYMHVKQHVHVHVHVEDNKYSFGKSTRIKIYT